MFSVPRIMSYARSSEKPVQEARSGAISILSVVVNQRSVEVYSCTVAALNGEAQFNTAVAKIFYLIKGRMQRSHT